MDKEGSTHEIRGRSIGEARSLSYRVIETKDIEKVGKKIE